jgi:hypothetical protein
MDDKTHDIVFLLAYRLQQNQKKAFPFFWDVHNFYSRGMPANLSDK